MFDGIARHYDLLNRLISLGLDRGWRQEVVRSVHIQPGARVLDLGCGTGDLAQLLALRHAELVIVGVDLSAEMLGRARARLGQNVGLVQASAFELPFQDGCFSAAVSGFLLRNLHDLERALRELARVAAHGADIALLDATRPPPGLRRALFLAYFRVAAPGLGALFGQRRAYTYLRDSLVQIPDAATMCRLLTQAGFVGCRARPLTLGAVTLFTATRS